MKTLYINLKTFPCLFLLVLSSCDKMFLPEPEGNNEIIFEQVWRSFKEDYALFEERNVDWDAIYLQFKPLVNEGTTEAGLFKILSDMLKPIEDGHVALVAPHLGSFDANKYFRERIEDELFNPDLIRSAYLEKGFKSDHNKWFYGKIKGNNIGYIFFNQFRNTAVKLEDFINEFPGLNGYIVDLRHNNGGDVSLSFSFLGRFTTEKKLFLRSKTKNGKGQDDYTPWHEWYIHSSGKYIDKPLIILTDRYTVSAAERMVMAAKTLPNAMILGDTTNGTFGTKISRELANGWYYSYSIQKVQMYDGKSYEGIGLSPDVYVKNKIQDIVAGEDKVLEKAIQLIND